MISKLVKDLAKKRREYLRKKSQIYVSMGFGILLLLLSPLLILLSLPIILFDSHAIPDYIRDGWEKAQALPYVPPIAEQIAALPAAEILVRGSVQPAATPEELLIAANVSTETASDELLRSDTSVMP